MEKKKEVNEKMKSFREKSPGAAEVPEAELMGGGDSIGELKRMKQEAERKKTEREVRKEEILRARMAERFHLLINFFLFLQSPLSCTGFCPGYELIKRRFLRLLVKFALIADIVARRESILNVHF